VVTHLLAALTAPPLLRKESPSIWIMFLAVVTMKIITCLFDRLVVLKEQPKQPL
jgi:hypothetical protein